MSQNKLGTQKTLGWHLADIYNRLDDLEKGRRRSAVSQSLGGVGSPTPDVYGSGLWNLSNAMMSPFPAIMNPYGYNGLALDKNELIWKQLFNPDGFPLSRNQTPKPDVFPIPVNLYKQHGGTTGGSHINDADPMLAFDVTGDWYEDPPGNHFWHWRASQSPGCPMQMFITKEGKIRSLNRYELDIGSNIDTFEILDMGTIEGPSVGSVLHSWSPLTPSIYYDGLLIDANDDEWSMVQTAAGASWIKIGSTDTVACPSSGAIDLTTTGIIGKWFAVMDYLVGPLFVWSAGEPGFPVNWKINLTPQYEYGLHLLAPARLYYGKSSLKVLVPANPLGPSQTAYDISYTGWVFVYDVPAAFTPDAKQMSLT